jgi:hypothetical protein
VVDESDGLLDGGPLVKVVSEECSDVATGVEWLLGKDGLIDDAVSCYMFHDLLQEVDLVVVEVGLVNK